MVDVGSPQYPLGTKVGAIPIYTYKYELSQKKHGSNFSLAKGESRFEDWMDWLEEIEPKTGEKEVVVDVIVSAMQRKGHIFEGKKEERLSEWLTREKKT